jgi:hypothetical protein
MLDARQIVVYEARWIENSFAAGCLLPLTDYLVWPMVFPGRSLGNDLKVEEVPQSASKKEPSPQERTQDDQERYRFEQQDPQGDLELREDSGPSEYLSQEEVTSPMAFTPPSRPALKQAKKRRMSAVNPFVTGDVHQHKLQPKIMASASKRSFKVYDDGDDDDEDDEEGGVETPFTSSMHPHPKRLRGEYGSASSSNRRLPAPATSHPQMYQRPFLPSSHKLSPKRAEAHAGAQQAFVRPFVLRPSRQLDAPRGLSAAEMTGIKRKYGTRSHK